MKTLPHISSGHFVLKGTNLHTVHTVLFNSKGITNKYFAKHDSWWASGYYRNQGAGELWFYPPQGLAPGNYVCRVQSSTGISNSLLLSFTDQSQPVVRSSKAVFVGLDQTIMISRGPHPVGTMAFLTASTSNQPSVLPGLYKFGIGANFTQLVVLPGIPFNGNGVAQLTFPVIKSMNGLTAYFQVGYLNAAGPIWPMPTSDIWSTTYVQ